MAYSPAATALFDCRLIGNRNSDTGETRSGSFAIDGRTDHGLIAGFREWVERSYWPSTDPIFSTVRCSSADGNPMLLVSEFLEALPASLPW